MILKSNMARMYGCKNGRLLTPGNNLLSDKESELILQEPTVKILIEKRQLEIVKVEKENKPESELKPDETFGDPGDSKDDGKNRTREEAVEKSARSILEYKVDIAEDVIADILDILVLRRIKELDQRKGIIAAVEKQEKIILSDRKDGDKNK